MDAFELLLRASDPEMNLGNEVKDLSFLAKGKSIYDYRDHMTNTMLDPIDSIMMLADQACQKSPIRKPSGARPLSPDTMKQDIDEDEDEEFGDTSSGMGKLLQYGSYFNMGSPLGGVGNRRSRAMSEPWLRQDASWSEELQFNRTMGTALSGNAGSSTIILSSGTSALNGSSDKNGSAHFPSFSFGNNSISSVPRVGLYNAEHELNHRLGYSSMETSLPQMLDQYSSIYNKNGRIGIYTREERSAIIQRFREKRKRRVWKKKIRYFCRKNLADRRVRVKGRFVKSAAGAKVPSSGASTNGSDSSPSTSTSKSTTAAAAALASFSGKTTTSAQRPRGGSSKARSALLGAAATGDSEEQEEEEEGEEGDSMDEDEGEGYTGDEQQGRMPVVEAPVVAAAATDKKPARRFKLVLTASNPAATTTATISTTGADVAHTAAVKDEGHHHASGVDLLASLAARTAEEGDDSDEQDEDVFTSEMLRLPFSKRTRRHSIAY